VPVPDIGLPLFVRSRSELAGPAGFRNHARAKARGILGRAMSQENVELTRRGYQAFNDRDLDALLAGLHDEVEAFPRLAAVEGRYRGHDG
jgi:hypothetical protein